MEKLTLKENLQSLSAKQKRDLIANWLMSYKGHIIPAEEFENFDEPTQIEYLKSSNYHVRWLLYDLVYDEVFTEKEPFILIMQQLEELAESE